MSAREEVVRRLNWLIQGTNQDIGRARAGSDAWEEGYQIGYKNAMLQALGIIASEYEEES